MSNGHREHHDSISTDKSWTVPWSYTRSGQSHKNQARHDYSIYDCQTSALVSMDTSHIMSQPPPYGAFQYSAMLCPSVEPQHHSHWPSQLYAIPSCHPPVLAAVPIQTLSSTNSMSTDSNLAGLRKATTRRKLTDDERRLMCLEAENNPSMKQTQIGAKFNVERR